MPSAVLEEAQLHPAIRARVADHERTIVQEVQAAIRDHAVAAQAMGVDVRHCKAMTFGVSAAFTGVGGALSAIAVQFVSPDSFDLFLSISLLVGIVVGGVGTLWGALYGAIFIMFVPNLAEQVSKAAPWAVYGVVLIAIMMVMPGGVVGLMRQIQRQMRTLS